MSKRKKTKEKILTDNYSQAVQVKKPREKNKITKNDSIYFRKSSWVD